MSDNILQPLCLFVLEAKVKIYVIILLQYDNNYSKGAMDTNSSDIKFAPKSLRANCTCNGMAVIALLISHHFIVQNEEMRAKDESLV